MKQFKITTTVDSIKTLNYTIIANSEYDALEQLNEGSLRGTGEVVFDGVDWGSEIIKYIDLIEDTEPIIHLSKTQVELTLVELDKMIHNKNISKAYVVGYMEGYLRELLKISVGEPR